MSNLRDQIEPFHEAQLADTNDARRGDMEAGP